MGFNWSWNPIENISSIGQGLYDGITNAWNDYTGVTASQMSAKASKENTEKQLAWERERATSAHQWEVEDLKKAGLNPILSAGGSGAVTGGISPQMPDYSQYKGMGALIPLISNFYDNLTKNSTSAKAKADADLSYTKQFTEKTQQILNTYSAGLIDKKTAGQAIENEINKTNLKWLPWEKGVGIAKDVVGTVLPAALAGKGLKKIGTSATQITNKLSKIQKSINDPWKKMGKGKKVNMLTGEIKETKPKLKTYKINIIPKK